MPCGECARFGFMNCSGMPLAAGKLVRNTSCRRTIFRVSRGHQEVFGLMIQAGLADRARKKGEPFTQVHKDFVAALQVAKPVKASKVNAAAVPRPPTQFADQPEDAGAGSGGGCGHEEGRRPMGCASWDVASGVPGESLEPKAMQGRVASGRHERTKLEPYGL
jgi:hypothetical protein